MIIPKYYRGLVLVRVTKNQLILYKELEGVCGDQ